VKDWLAEMEAMPSVKRWYEARAVNSRNSADINLRNLLRSLHDFGGLTPADLVAMEQRKLEETMQDLVQHFLRKKLAGSTVSKYVDSIRSYLQWEDRELRRALSIPGADDSPNAEAQEIPAPDAAGALLMACDLRTAVIASLEMFSGVRPQVIGKFDASDGLMLGDLPELEIKSDKVSFAAIPTIIRVRKNLSKTRKAYVTFLGPEGCDYLLNYLRSRLAAGETLTNKSPLVSAHSGTPRFLHRGNIQDCLRIRMRALDFKATSYILRSYFGNRMIVAETHGVLSIYREFWMGHKGGLQTRYGLRKELPPDVIENMRTSYRKALPFLETRQQPDQEDPMRRLTESILKAAGSTEEDVQKMDLDGMGEESLVQLLTDGLAKRVQQTATTAPAPKGQAKQKVVGAQELANFLEQGWTYKATVEGGQVILEAPQ
jgi:hypothetical protein